MNSSLGSSAILVPDQVDHGHKIPKTSRFSFSRRQKGTEHLEQAASRKSADQRSSSTHSQRYIILPATSRRTTTTTTTTTSANQHHQQPLHHQSECILTRDPVPEPDSPTHILLPEPLAPPRPSAKHPGMSGTDSASGSHHSHPHPVLSNSSSSSNNNNNNNNNTISSATSSTSSTTGHWPDQSESLMHKPPRGWLHPDHMIRESGVTYNVKYVGCLQINTSMRSLDFETRSRIAKECIARVCEAAGLCDPDTSRRPDSRILKMLAEQPDMSLTGSDVSLSITSATLNLTVIDTGEVIAQHSMPNISFASGGDSDMSDFVAYVAKDSAHGRACYVLDCLGGRAQEVISTIGQAFELRFKEFLKRTPRPECRVPDVERDYYNDLPGKVPPDTLRPASPLHSDLIDLVVVDSSSVEDAGRDYVNCDVPAAGSLVKDPFDMQPFNSTLRELSEGLLLLGSPAPDSARRELESEEWFHGPISRKESETLVVEDGDFLVRESAGCSGQFVLTGRNAGVCKHLLLVDPDGVVRTKDRSFDSVSHLVHYHEENRLPIISAESSLRLKRPVRFEKDTNS